MTDEPRTGPALLVLSTLFPHPGRPGGGLFVRERLFRVGQHLPLVVVSPQAWSPVDAMIRKLRPHYRPLAPDMDVQSGFEVYYPRFFSLPGIGRSLDGFFMALGARRLVKQLQAEGRVEHIDAHFGFPDGTAAAFLGRWLGLTHTVTLRGTEPRLSKPFWRRTFMRWGLKRAARVFAVAGSLGKVAESIGVPSEQIEVVGNGVDTERFQPVDKQAARKALGLPQDAQVLVSVGGLVERKGFHRVIECLPNLLSQHPKLHFLVVGGASAEGDWSERLQAQVAELKLQDQVHFLGSMAPDELKQPLSAADVFVLATSNEGWANVFLEAMACGLPVVTTDVGGNPEVVHSEALGFITSFGDAEALEQAMHQALEKNWDRDAILQYAHDNAWDTRVTRLLQVFRAIHAGDVSLATQSLETS